MALLALTSLHLAPTRLGWECTNVPRYLFTPTVTSNKASSTYNGYLNEDTKYGFNIGSAGAVFVFENPDSRTNGEWKSFQFGVGYNRLANFNNNYLISGRNPKTSLLTGICEFGKRLVPR